LRLSTKGRYGVRGMLDLALHYGQGPISIKSIAERQEISLHYIEQLFVKLRRAGLITSVRGPNGGYLLNKPPSDIRIGDIIRVVEGSIAPVYCVDMDGECKRADICVARLLWMKVRDKIAEVLDSTTLEDLCKEDRELRKREELDHSYTFYI